MRKKWSSSDPGTLDNIYPNGGSLYLVRRWGLPGEQRVVDLLHVERPRLQRQEQRRVPPVLPHWRLIPDVINSFEEEFQGSYAVLLCPFILLRTFRTQNILLSPFKDTELSFCLSNLPNRVKIVTNMDKLGHFGEIFSQTILLICANLTAMCSVL